MIKRFTLLFLLILPVVVRAQTPITPSWTRQTTQTGILDTIGMNYSGQITKQYFGSTAWTRRYMINKADTNTFSVTQYQLTHQSRTYNGPQNFNSPITVFGTGGNSITINGNSITNSNSLSAISLLNDVKFISGNVFQFSTPTTEFLRITPDGNIQDRLTGKLFLKQGDAPTSGQVDSLNALNNLRAVTARGYSSNNSLIPRVYV